VEIKKNQKINKYTVSLSSQTVLRG